MTGNGVLEAALFVPGSGMGLPAVLSLPHLKIGREGEVQDALSSGAGQEP